MNFIQNLLNYVVLKIRLLLGYSFYPINVGFHRLKMSTCAEHQNMVIQAKIWQRISNYAHSTISILAVHKKHY